MKLRKGYLKKLKQMEKDIVPEKQVEKELGIKFSDVYENQKEQD